MQEFKYTCDSGRVVRFREPTILTSVRLYGTLPDLGGKQREFTQEEQIHSNIRLVCECSVEPRFWADLRPEVERAREPWSCPEGFTELDLTPGEFWEVVKRLAQFTEEAQAAADPF